jgi:hypothetical protein
VHARVLVEVVDDVDHDLFAAPCPQGRSEEVAVEAPGAGHPAEAEVALAELGVQVEHPPARTVDL